MKFYKSEAEYNQEKINSSFLELLKDINIKKEAYTNNYGEAPKVIVMTQTEFKIAWDYCNGSYWGNYGHKVEEPTILGMKIIVE